MLAWPETRFSQFVWLVSVFVLVGCGAPGEPVPPTPLIPTAIADLTAQQAGDGVMLTFTMPGKSVSGEKLKDISAMEVLRGSLAADGTPDEKTFRVVETVPGAMIASYSEKGKVHLLDPVPAEEIRTHSGQSVVYQVRARVTDKKTSAGSNDVTLKLFPVAATVETLQAHLTEQGIELTWTAPEHTSGGEASKELRNIMCIAESWTQLLKRQRART